MDSWQAPEADPGPQITEWLIKHIPLGWGTRVLEIAAGSGTVTFAAARLARKATSTLTRATSFVCTDLNVASVASAAARHRNDARSATTRNGETFATTRDSEEAPSIAFLAADMRRLPFGGGVFDAALCRFGFMFAPEPAAAFREARRVLRRGGRLAFAVWGTPEENPWQSHLDETLTAFGVEDRSAQRLPGGMFGLPDPAHVRQILEEGGFSVLELARVEFARRYRDFDEYWAREVDVGVDGPRRLRTLSPQTMLAFRARLEAALLPYREEDGYRIPGLSRAVVALA